MNYIVVPNHLVIIRYPIVRTYPSQTNIILSIIKKVEYAGAQMNSYTISVHDFFNMFH